MNKNTVWTNGFADRIDKVENEFEIIAGSAYIGKAPTFGEARAFLFKRNREVAIFEKEHDL